MYRLGFGLVAAAAGFALISGCTLSEHRLFGRRACPSSECCSDSGMIAADGPIVGGCSSGNCVPPAPAMVGPVPLVPQPTTPQLAPPPRLIPQPQAQPAPFTP
jgi:hypothetical protein